MDNTLNHLIVDEVLRRIREMRPAPLEPGGTLVVAASHVVAPEVAREILEKRFAPIRYAVLPEDADGFDGMDDCAGAWSEKKLLQAAAESQNIVLLSPGPETLIRIACGEETAFLERVMLRTVLWGKKIVVMPDYEMPKYKRGTFFEKLADAADALRELGIEIAAYSCFAGSGSESLSLVTERDVEEAHALKKGRIACVRSAIITPAARDRAEELDIKIDW